MAISTKNCIPHRLTQDWEKACCSITAGSDDSNGNADANVRLETACETEALSECFKQRFKRPEQELDSYVRNTRHAGPRGSSCPLQRRDHVHPGRRLQAA